MDLLRRNQNCKILLTVSLSTSLSRGARSSRTARRVAAKPAMSVGLGAMRAMPASRCARCRGVRVNVVVPVASPARRRGEARPRERDADADVDDRRRMPRLRAASNDDAHLPRLYVPGDALGGESPELKAAQTLRRLFTYVAIRVVQSHIEGAGNDGGFAPQVTGRDGRVMCPDYDDLRNAMEGIPLGDGDEWLDEFMKINSTVALRIITARETYAKQFDYGLAKKYAEELVEKGNAQLMKRHASRSFSSDAEEQQS